MGDADNDLRREELHKLIEEEAREIAELRQLIDDNARGMESNQEMMRALADRVLILADRVVKAVEELQSVKRTFSEASLANDERERGLAFAQTEAAKAHAAAVEKYAKEQGRLAAELAALRAGVGKVERIGRENSAVQKLQDAEKKTKSTTGELLQTFRELPTYVKVLLIMLGIVLATHVELASLLKIILHVE